jgi:NADPH:quinone reductase-like Zn-dependent oxidoreductase
VDNVGNRSLLENRRVLKPEGIFVNVTGPKTGKFIGPMTRPIKALMPSPFVSQEFVFMLAELTQEDLGFPGDLIQAGKVTPVIDRRYQLNEVAEAVR